LQFTFLTSEIISHEISNCTRGTVFILIFTLCTIFITKLTLIVIHSYERSRVASSTGFQLSWHALHTSSSTFFTTGSCWVKSITIITKRTLSGRHTVWTSNWAFIHLTINRYSIDNIPIMRKATDFFSNKASWVLRLILIKDNHHQVFVHILHIFHFLNISISPR
jgi:hypothetical protein